MGEAVGRQDRLFYEFDLEDMVPSDHLLRRIDAVLELGWLRGEMAPYYSHTGGQVRFLLDKLLAAASFEVCLARPFWASYS